MCHPSVLTLFNNVHLGRGRRCLLVFAFACAALLEEEIAKATAGEREKQKTDDQANYPFPIRGATGVGKCQWCDRTTPQRYAYLLAVWASGSTGPLSVVVEEGTPMDMPVISVVELDLRGWK